VLTIGITGPSGAGKSSALRALESLGALAIDCDKIYHELLLENDKLKSELTSRFDGVVRDCVVDRKLLGEIVFSDLQALSDLNAITHKYVAAERERRVAQWIEQGDTVIAVEAIALIEAGIAKECDIVVGVTAPVEIRIARIMERDGIEEASARKRVMAQKPDSFFAKHCDYLLENVYNTSDEFEEKCKAFFAELIGRYVP